MSAILFTALFSFIASAAGEFNTSVCPFYWEVYAPKVPESFSLDRFVGGFYYELALHDKTQYPLCPKPGCITSNKTWVSEVGDGRSQIHDAFTLGCFGKPYPVEYFFNVTEHPGFLDGFVVDPPKIWDKLGFSEYYPDTIVDFEIDEATGLYDWVIEFQCTEDAKNGGVDFTGFNFYSRQQQPGDEYIDNMIQRARDRGLGVYLDTEPGVFRVPMDEC